MHFELRFLITSLISYLLCFTIKGSEIQNNTEYDESVIDYSDEDLNSEENICSIDQFVNDLNVTSLLPDDYKPVINDEELSGIVPHINQTIERIDRIVNWTQKLYNNNEIVRAMKLIGSRISETLFESDLPPKCLASILKVMDGIRNGKLWAIKFFDSYGNLMPSGLAEGRLASFGEYDECIGIKSPPEEQNIIFGKYCTLSLIIPFPPLKSYSSEYEEIFKERIIKNEYSMNLIRILEDMKVDNYFKVNPLLKIMDIINIYDGQTLRLGICIPHTCRPQDIEKAINKIQFPITQFPVHIQEESCSVNSLYKTSLELDMYQIFSVVVFSVLSILVILSTSYEIGIISNEKFFGNKKTIGQSKTWGKFLISFSAIANTNKLLKVDNRFAALDTIRLFLTFGVYSLQFFDFTFMMGTVGLKRVTESVPMHWLSKNRYWFAKTPSIWIDGFMFNIGLNLSYTMLNKLKLCGGRFNYGIYLWKRWLRLSILMSGTFLVIYLMPLTGDGPIWHISNQMLQPSCRDKWSILSSFLYYSNWNAKINDYKLKTSFPICNPPTWFLSGSTQIYVFAPILFLSLYKWPKFGVLLNIFLIIFGVLTALSPKLLFGSLTYFEKTRIQSFNHWLHSLLSYHTNPLQYITTFSFGMLTGYLIRKRPDIYLGGRKKEILLWIISFSNIIAIYCWNNTFSVQNESPPEISVLLWFGLGKVLYGFALAWISFACCTGRGGIVNRFLSIRLLQPIAKLSYGIYLLRLPTIFHRIFTIRYAYVMTDFETLQNTIVGFITTTLLAYLLYILLECPSNNLIKIFEQQNPNQVIYPNHNNIDLNNNNNNILFVENKKTINKYNECSKL